VPWQQGAAFLLGCLTGFLFGIPRAPTHERAVPQTEKITDPATAAGKQVSGYRPNTNLEQISDWLTKILVGVGLTQLAQAPRAASALASALSPILGDAPHSGGFGLAMVIYFFVGGFFLTYLWTRLKLGAAFREADLAGIGNQLRNLEAQLSDHLAVRPRHDD
jgi:hypothetical protein